MAKNPSDPDTRTGPTRNKLEVGLARYDKPPKKIPPWLEERIGVIVVGIAVLCVVAWAFFRTPKSSGPTAELKIVSGPLKVWIDPEKTQLQSVESKIRNVGKTPAEGIVVTVLVDSQPYQLAGPPSLAPGQSGSYEGIHDSFTAAAEPLSGAVACSNCQ